MINGLMVCKRGSCRHGASGLCIFFFLREKVTGARNSMLGKHCILSSGRVQGAREGRNRQEGVFRR